MTPMRMHHVGVILPTIEAAKEFMEKIGLEVDYTSFVSAYNADLIFTKYTEKESPIEFIIPRGGVLKDFNEGRGGIHHIAYEVEDVAAVTKEFTEKGLFMLEKDPVTGSDDLLVNFLRPKYGNGILVEFVQTVAPINREHRIEGVN